MQKFSLIFLIFCLASYFTLGSIAFENEHHHQYDEIHSLMHELGQPHSHDEQEYENTYLLSFSKDAIKHVNQDLNLFTLATFENPSSNLTTHHLSLKTPLFIRHWSSPLIKTDTPPPKA